MFVKLFKYDFISIIKKLVFYYIVLIAIAVFSKILQLITQNGNFAFVNIIPTMGYYMCISLGPTLTIILCMVRYYKNMLSDQGYLTHTLPVKRSTILLSKIFVTLVMQVVTLCVMLLSLLIFSFEAFPYIVEGLLELMKEINPSHAGVIGIIILILFEVIFLAVFQVTEIAMCLTLGASFNKNKLVYAFLFYMGVNFILEIILTMGMIVISIMLSTLEVSLTLGHAYLFLGIIIFFTILGVIGTYFINLIVLNKKLNLE